MGILDKKLLRDVATGKKGLQGSGEKFIINGT